MGASLRAEGVAVRNKPNTVLNEIVFLPFRRHTN